MALPMTFLLLLLVSLLPPACPAFAKKAPRGKAKRSASKGGQGFGGSRSALAPLPPELDPQLAAALAARRSALHGGTDAAKTWMETGALLVKAAEYGEAARVFREGAARHHSHEMLQAAALTFNGDSAMYHPEAGGRWPAPPTSDSPPPAQPGAVLDPLSDASFGSYEVCAVARLLYTAVHAHT
jgi:hypothetical protein